MTSLQAKAAALLCGLSIAGAGLISTGFSPGLATIGVASAQMATPAAQQSDTTPANCDIAGSEDQHEDDQDHEERDGAGQNTENQETDEGAAEDSGAGAAEDENGASETETDAAPGQLSEGQDLLPKASISLDRAVTIATGEAQGTLGDVELEDENGTLVFKVQVGDKDVAVDATTGAVLGVEAVDADDQEHCDDEAQVAPGTLDDGADLLAQATISLDDAVKTAQGAASGQLGEVDLEMNDNGVLVFSVEIGEQEVEVDATTGAVVNIVDADA